MTRFDLEPLRERITTWRTERGAMSDREAAGQPVLPGDWHRSDVEATTILVDLAELMGIGCDNVWTVTVADHTRYDGEDSHTYAVHAGSAAQATAWTLAWHAHDHDATDVAVDACEPGMPLAYVWDDVRAQSRNQPDPAAFTTPAQTVQTETEESA
ncbi:hypothetical protein [Nonomuraea recticatena]|uniref:Immunity protein Imm1 n=1 Tax=Nonomuraea recticatena TaxID=46178 RepID=A0ABN3RP97_9ACTN